MFVHVVDIQLTVTNHSTLATVDAPNGSKAQLPLSLNDGWQMIPIDIAGCVNSIWGTQYKLTEQVLSITIFLG